VRRRRALLVVIAGLSLLAVGWWLLRERAPAPKFDYLAADLARLCPCDGAATSITDVGLIGPEILQVGQDHQLIGPLDFGAPIPQDELPLAPLFRAIDDGSAAGQQLTLIQATRRRDLGLELLRFQIEGSMHSARLYVVDEASRAICCKGYLSTYLLSVRGR
jgi:hypothetical protein